MVRVEHAIANFYNAYGHLELETVPYALVVGINKRAMRTWFPRSVVTPGYSDAYPSIQFINRPLNGRSMWNRRLMCTWTFARVLCIVVANIFVEKNGCKVVRVSVDTCRQKNQLNLVDNL